MGGRRAKSITEVVGSSLAPLRARFGRALSEKDPDAVATAAARLIAGGDKAADILYWASRLARFVQEAADSSRHLDYSEREALARKEWSRIKKAERLPDDPITTQALVAAVAKAIGKER